MEHGQHALGRRVVQMVQRRRGAANALGERLWLEQILVRVRLRVRVRARVRVRVRARASLA